MCSVETVPSYLGFGVKDPNRYSLRIYLFFTGTQLVRKGLNPSPSNSTEELRYVKIGKFQFLVGINLWGILLQNPAICPFPKNGRNSWVTFCYNMTENVTGTYRFSFFHFRNIFLLNYMPLINRYVQLPSNFFGQRTVHHYVWFILCFCLSTIQGILLVFDITNKASFEGVEKWITYIREVRQWENKEGSSCLLQ